MIRYIILSMICIFSTFVWALPNDVIDIGNRRELFVDEYMVENLEGLTLRMHHPRLAPPSSAPTENGAYATVIYDEKAGVYHYYYRGAQEAEEENEHFQTAYFYMSSPDGIHWQKPDLDLFPEYGRAARNMILKPEDPVSHNFSPFLDDRPDVPPDERFKAIAGATGIWSTKGKGLYGFVSSDGVHWRKIQQEPIFPVELAGEQEVNNYFDSQNVAFYSETEHCYVCYYRTTWLPESHGWAQSLRGMSRTTSEDFIHWTPGVELPVNLPGEQFYTNQTSPYFRAPHIYIALPWRYLPHRPGNIHNYPSDTVLMSARGAEVYDRLFTEAFIRPGLDPAYWRKTTRPRGIATALNVVPTSDTEMSIYAGEKRYTLRLDGFASLHAEGFDYGHMTTKPFLFKGQQLKINYSTSAAGRIFIGIKDQYGQLLPGYSLNDCPPIVGNEISRVVTWENGDDISSLEGTPVRLHIKMRDADLYSFRFQDVEQQDTDNKVTDGGVGFSYIAAEGTLPSGQKWTPHEIQTNAAIGSQANAGIVTVDGEKLLHINDCLSSRDLDLPLFYHAWGNPEAQKALWEKGIRITMVYQCNSSASPSSKGANGFIGLGLGGTGLDKYDNILPDHQYFIWDLASYASLDTFHTLIINAEPESGSYNISFSIDNGPAHSLQNSKETVFSGAFGFGSGSSKATNTNMYVKSIKVEPTTTSNSKRNTTKE